MYLILFDIDGTLVLTGRAGWRAMNRACADEVGHDRALDGVEFAGRTDWSILGDIMRKADKPMDRPTLDRLNRRYVAHLAEEIQLPGTGVKDVMPGIRPLIDALERRDGCGAGTADRQLRRRRAHQARILRSVEALSVRRIRRRCRTNRNDLVPVAIRRAREAGVADVEPSRVIVVGDTPNDVECARVAGATPVAVATGSYTVEQLRETGADIVFKDLSNTHAFLDLWSNARATRDSDRLPSRASYAEASEGWRERLGVEPSPPAQRGRRPILKTGRATGPRSLPMGKLRLSTQPQAIRDQLLPFAAREAEVGASPPPARRIRRCRSASPASRPRRPCLRVPRRNANAARRVWNFDVTMITRVQRCVVTIARSRLASWAVLSTYPLVARMAAAGIPNCTSASRCSSTSLGNRMPRCRSRASPAPGGPGSGQ